MEKNLNDLLNRFEALQSEAKVIKDALKPIENQLSAIKKQIEGQWNKIDWTGEKDTTMFEQSESGQWYSLGMRKSGRKTDFDLLKRMLTSEQFNKAVTQSEYFNVAKVSSKKQIELDNS